MPPTLQGELFHRGCPQILQACGEINICNGVKVGPFVLTDRDKFDEVLVQSRSLDREVPRGHPSLTDIEIEPRRRMRRGPPT